MKNYPMQYADREISVEDALEVLDEGEFITVATVDDDGMPYCVPLSYVVERGWGSVEGAGEGEEPVCRIYIHTTKNDGRKMADWRRDARVWGSVACEVEPCYEETFFTTRFASAMVAGRIRHVESSLAVRKMLVALCMKTCLPKSTRLVARLNANSISPTFGASMWSASRARLVDASRKRRALGERCFGMQYE